MPDYQPIKEDLLFWKYVQKTDGCWLWTGATGHFGHGKVRRSGRDYVAHRLSWGFANGGIPEGLCVLHRCDVPQCVRPDHLFLGSKADNNADKVAKGRQPSGEWLRQRQAVNKARGDRSGARLHPERLCRGDRHWTRLNPVKAKASALRGEAHHAAKLTASDVAEMKRLRADGWTLVKIGARFGTSFQHVSEIVRGLKWSSV